MLKQLYEIGGIETAYRCDVVCLLHRREYIPYRFQTISKDYDFSLTTGQVQLPFPIVRDRGAEALKMSTFQEMLLITVYN